MLNPTAAQPAIKAALHGHWEEAVEHNLAILDAHPQDIDALNRLAKAYTELGQLKKASLTYQKVLQLDRYNQIAQKNLPKLQALKFSPTFTHPGHSHQANVFIEEPGKTKTVNLIKVTNTKLINQLSPGQPVSLIPKTHTVSIITPDGTYIGALPDDLSRHLIKLIRLGNKYQAVVRLAQKNTLQILIQETFRSKRSHQAPSST